MIFVNMIDLLSKFKKNIGYIILFLTMITNAQEINQFDENNKRHGVWEQRYENGRIRYEGAFVHGREIGDFYFYDNKIHNNYPSIKKVFYEDVNYEEVTFYYDGGQKRSEGKMIGKKRDGLWKYYNTAGKIILEENYIDGNLNGVQNVYFKTGQLTEIRNYSNNKLHGIVTRFSQHGDTLHTLTYSKGKLNGRTSLYEANGVIRESGLYYNNYRVGKWDFYIDGKFVGYKKPKGLKDSELEDEIIYDDELTEEDNPVYSSAEDEAKLRVFGEQIERKLALEREALLRKKEKVKFKKAEKEKALSQKRTELATKKIDQLKEEKVKQQEEAAQKKSLEQQKIDEKFKKLNETKKSAAKK